MKVEVTELRIRGKKVKEVVDAYVVEEADGRLRSGGQGKFVHPSLYTLGGARRIVSYLAGHRWRGNPRGRPLQAVLFVLED